jgi:hypothetical protein
MPNPGAVYDFALRCAIRACLEQTTNEQAQLNVASARKESHRHSVHLSNMGEKLGNLADKITTLDLKNDKKITRPFAQGLMKRLDNIRHGKDTSKSEYSDKRFQIIAKVVRDHVKQYRSTGESVNDIVIFFLRTSEAELKKMDPNPAVWFKDLDRYVARFAELLLIVLKEDAPQSATPELIESLNRSIMPSKQAQPKKKQVYDNLLDTLENFPMVQTVQQLFHISLQDHRQKLRELQHVCTEAVRRIPPPIFVGFLFTCINI